ncbi:unnamed protein product (macronuclear) [Paramecium tetraurelia]|uniref:LisH domain-containing protein n=1 Tax=Paramecium tetraurelia TaxID=5888 RepID=A0CGV4_PARTE|nr:uncharacterized protein GSPATT00007461001 [Paramecium tetraurelia]CAK70021.1 unnamed protein product [Paramecium tetraurelia]|eukprot:XP_001437418.1 hypothetical protein (macronuclear) [Paramecium tetraurelia strain d4-2]
MEDFNDDDIRIFVGKFQDENQTSILDQIMNQKESQGQNCNSILKKFRQSEQRNNQISKQFQYQVSTFKIIVEFLYNKNLRYGDLEKQNRQLMSQQEQFKLDISQLQVKLIDLDQDQTKSRNQKKYDLMDQMQQLKSQIQVEQVMSDQTEKTNIQEVIDKQSKIFQKQDSLSSQNRIVNAQIVMEQEQKIVDLEKLKIELEQKISELDLQIKKSHCKFLNQKRQLNLKNNVQIQLIHCKENATLQEELRAAKENIGVESGVNQMNIDELSLREKNLQLTRDLQAAKQQLDIAKNTYEKQITQQRIQIENYAKTNLVKEDQVLQLQKTLQSTLEEKENYKKQLEKMADSKNLDGESTLKECKIKLRKYEGLLQQANAEIEIKAIQIQEQHSNQLIDIINIIESYNKENLQINQQLEQQIQLVEQLKNQKENQLGISDQNKCKELEEQINKQKMTIQRQKKQIEQLEKQNNSKVESEQQTQNEKKTQNLEDQNVIDNLKNMLQQLYTKIKYQDQISQKDDIQIREQQQQILERDEWRKHFEESNSMIQNTSSKILFYKQEIAQLNIRQLKQIIIILILSLNIK